MKIPQFKIFKSTQAKFYLVIGILTVTLLGSYLFVSAQISQIRLANQFLHLASQQSALSQRSGIVFLLFLETKTFSERQMFHARLKEVAAQAESNYQELSKAPLPVYLEIEKQMPLLMKKSIEEYIINLNAFVSPSTEDLPYFISNPSIAFIWKSVKGPWLTLLNDQVSSYAIKNAQHVTAIHRWIWGVILLNVILLALMTRWLFAFRRFPRVKRASIVTEAIALEPPPFFAPAGTSQFVGVDTLSDNDPIAEAPVEPRKNSSIVESKESAGDVSHLKDKLLADLAAMSYLHELSSKAFSLEQFEKSQQEILNFMIKRHQATSGTIQLYKEDIGILKIIAHRGFKEDFLEYFDNIQVSSRDSVGSLVLQERRPIIISDVETDDRYAFNRHIAASVGYRAVCFIPIFSRDNNILGIISIYFKEPNTALIDDNMQITNFFVRLSSELIERKYAEEAREENEKALELELADMKRLQETSARLVPQGDVDVILKEIIDTAITLTHANRGTIQLMDETGQLSLLAAKGFDKKIEKYGKINRDSCTVCGFALKAGKRVVVTNFATDPQFHGTEAAQEHSDLGIWAAQATPLVTRSGRIVGMISTHWEKPYEPTERELHSMDLLARQAADLIERSDSQEALKKANQDLKNLTANLEKHVEERTQQLEEQTERLQQLATELTEVEQSERKRLAEVLHDHLQQLLVAARIRLDLLERKAVNADKEGIAETREYIEQAVESSRSLAAELRPPVLFEGGLIPAMHFLARKFEKQHKLKVNLSIMTEAHPTSDFMKIMIYQSVQELLLNTVKYAQVNECFLKLERLEDGRVSISVQDQGVGFDPVKIGKSASGLGLFNIRERIHALGGEFHIASDPGKGSEFKLIFIDQVEPVVEPQQKTSREKVPTRVKDKETLSVLLVDDHKIVRQSLCNLLKSQTFIEKVNEAENGEDAINKVEIFDPDVVIMDLNMPKMNGIDATRILHQRNPRLKIIGLSIQTEEETAKAMKDAGAVAYFNKAEDISILMDALKNFTN